MFPNIIGVQDGKTRCTGIVISDDETSAAVIDLTADSSDDESPNAGAPPTAPSVPSSPGNSADAAMLLAPRTSSSSIMHVSAQPDTPRACPELAHAQPDTPDTPDTDIYGC